jgi:hypothetical protein
VYEARGDDKLSVEQIIGLYQVKQGLFGQIKTSVLIDLEKEGLIISSTGASNRYSLADPYSGLAAREQRIGNRYLVAEVEQYLMAIQGRVLKISELEEPLVGILSRNQIKFLTVKLLEDGILAKSGIKRGTQYSLSEVFMNQKGENLINEVVDKLRELHQVANA